MGFYVSANRSRFNDEARESKFLKYFVAGSLFLSAGVLLLAFQTESFTLSGIISKLQRTSEHNPYCGLVHHHGRYNSIAIYPFIVGCFL
jgi:NAD(P)H-quinone oxidoreductase subunit 5